MKAPAILLFYFCAQALFAENASSTNTLIAKLYEQNIALPKKDVLQKALAGFELLKRREQTKCTKNLLTVIDFSLPSTQKRFWVIDLNEYKVLYHTYVAHGKNTGENMAKHFSNVPNSNTSSLGFYLTGDTYFGKHGLSLRLHGMEEGFNDKAFDRAIVMHGADYVSEEFIARHGRLGRSFGCPALSNSLCKDVIANISQGACLFIYYPDSTYLENSKLLNDAAPLTNLL